MQGQDATLLLGDFLDLGLQLAVESIDGLVSLGTDQGGHGDLGEGGEQVQVVRSIDAFLAGAQDEQGLKLSLVDQGLGDGPAQEAQLPLRRVVRGQARVPGNQRPVGLHRLDERAAGRQFGQGRRAAQAIGQRRRAAGSPCRR